MLLKETWNYFDINMNISHWQSSCLSFLLTSLTVVLGHVGLPNCFLSCNKCEMCKFLNCAFRMCGLQMCNLINKISLHLLE